MIVQGGAVALAGGGDDLGEGDILDAALGEQSLGDIQQLVDRGGRGAFRSCVSHGAHFGAPN
jgi:hypothetical protein